MNYAYFVTGYKTGGVSRVSSEVIKRLTQKVPLDVYIFTKGNPDTSLPFFVGLAKINIKLVTIRNHFDWFSKFKEIETKYDKVILDHWYPLGIVALILSLKHKLRYSFWIYGKDVHYSKKKYLRPIFHKILSLIISKAEKVFAISKYTYDEILRSCGKHQNISIVPLGADHLPVVVVKKEQQDGNINLLSVGRLVERKGTHLVVSAIKLLQDKHNITNINFTIIGPGPMHDKIKRLVSDLQLEKNVFLRGYVPDEEVSKAYANADLFIMPSINIGGDFEGFGIVYVEALLRGVPIIAGKQGAGAEIVIPKVNGFAIDGSSAESIAMELAQIIKSKEYLSFNKENIIRSGQAYTWDKTINQILELLS